MVAIMVAPTAPAEDDASSSQTVYLPGLWSVIWRRLEQLESEAIAQYPQDTHPDLFTEDQWQVYKAKQEALYADLAAHAGMALAQFGAILTGAEPVDYSTALALADALNCSMGDLIDG